MEAEQPDLELGPGQARLRESLHALAQGSASDRESIDRIGLPALANNATGISHQPRRQPHDGLASIEQEPLQRAGHMPNILDHPNPFTIKLATPVDELTEAVASRAHRSLRDLHAKRVGRDPGVRLLVRIDPDRQHPSVPSLEPMKRTPGGHISVRALPSSY